MKQDGSNLACGAGNEFEKGHFVTIRKLEVAEIRGFRGISNRGVTIRKRAGSDE
jgi:hypothetical protein